MKLSVIIVNYNVKFYLGQCLYSLERALSGIEAEVYVVDNHSKDGSLGYLKKRFPKVHYIASMHNLGFARANNLAIRRSEGEYVLLLNPDTWIGENVLSDVLGFMDLHPDAGSLGVQMLNSDGRKAKESRRGLPTPMVSFYKMIGLCSRFPKHPRMGAYYMGDIPWDKPVRIDVVSGAFCLLRRSALNKAGLLDEDFFMYGEDIDLSFRILKSGYANWYYPAKILHYKGESTQKSSFRYVHVFYDAMLIFFRKHYGSMSFLLSIPIKIAIYCKAFTSLVGMLYSRILKSLGLFRPGRKYNPKFIFIGERDMQANFKSIADRLGLSAQFITANRVRFPKGHLEFMGESDNAGRQVYVVYDDGAYRYADILDIFSDSPMDNVYIGIYNRQSKCIITGEEVLK
ncbi:glycosyltransferase family 2 protein [Prevotella dentasini]|uniref:glycosyltransferase family 2 protein n=1 Tax=Prevotella dentasini TaxID=589537 RepID=UPI000468DBEB|nr:glycosyltransferase family 2 protein [Prevotella dentasini]